MSDELLQRVRMVMVNTTHPGNIGAAARAMKNMGLSRLYLVDPKEFPAEKAVWRAAGAVDVLDKVVVVSTLEEAIADCALVVGTSARGRRIPWPMLNPRECGERVVAEASHHEIAVVFGREDRGLTNEELQKCNYHVHIPSNPEYGVLNVASALQVLCYEIRMAWLALDDAEDKDKTAQFDEWDVPPADQEHMEHYFKHLEETLAQLNFLDPDNPRQTLTRIRRLYNRLRLDQMELAILRGMLTAVQNYIFHHPPRK